MGKIIHLEPANYQQPPALANNNKRALAAGSWLRVLNLEGSREREVPLARLSRAKQLELSVSSSVLASTEAAESGKLELALERAREASETLKRLRLELEHQKASEPPTGSSLFQLGLMVEANLGAQLAACGRLREALELYTNLCRQAGGGAAGSSTATSTDAGSLKQLELLAEPLTVGGQQYEARRLLHKFGLNIGNVYYRLNDFKRALKYFRLTLDRLTSMANLTSAGRQEVGQLEGEGEGQKGLHLHHHHHHEKHGNHWDTSGQLKLKLMNNIALALAEQPARAKTNNDSGGGGNRQIGAEQTITSLRLLLADNLAQSAARFPDGRHQQQVAPPEASCRNANHHAFGLNLMACLAVAGEGASAGAALKSLVGVDICHHFRRALEPARCEFEFDFACDPHSDSPPASGGAHAGESRHANQVRRASEPITGRKLTSAGELIGRALASLRADKLERLIEARESQTFRCLLLSCQLLQQLAGGASQDSGELLAGSASYAHLARDLKLAGALQAERASGHQLDRLVRVMRQVELPAGSEEPATRLVLSSSCFVNLSQSFAGGRESPALARAQQLARKCPEQLTNLANCFMAGGKFEQARRILEQKLPEDKWRAGYNLALVERLAGSGASSGALLKLLSERNLSQRLLSRRLQLSVLQAAFQTLDQSEPLPAPKVKLLGELLAAGRQAPEVYLLASSELDKSETTADQTDKPDGELRGRPTLLLLQQANREHPYHLPVLERLVALNIAGFDYNAARLLIRSCIKNRPDQVRWYQMLAECYRRQADYESASRIYRLAMERFPQDTSCLRALVKLAEELGLESQRAVYEQRLTRLLSAVR